MDKILIVVTSCLIGSNVRYNGGNCHKSYITGVYANYFDYKIVCPEVVAGLGVPRTTLFLVEDIQKGVLVLRQITHILMLVTKFSMVLIR